MTKTKESRISSSNPQWRDTYQTRDLMNYQEELNAQYQWIDITQGGNQLILSDDDFQQVNMGVNFTMYDQTYSSVYICSNGFIAFFDGGDLTDFINGQFPSNSHSWTIAPLWDDLNPGNGGGIYWDLLSNPSRFIVSWEAVPHYPSVGANTFQIILYPESGLIKMQYQALDVGNSPTVGINHGNNVHFNMPYYNNNPPTPHAIEFFLIIPPLPDSVVLSKAQSDPNTCFAGLNYRIEVQLTTYEGLYDIDDFRLQLDYNTTNITIGFDGDAEDFYKMGDPSDFLILLDNCTYDNDGVDKWWLNFSIRFNFTFPHEGAVDVLAVSLGKCERTQTRGFSDVLRVENDFDFSGVPIFTGETVGQLNEDEWVRGGEHITVNNLMVHYEGAPGLYPDDSLFNVKVSDTEGNSWWDNASAGEEVSINITTQNIVNPDEEYLVRIVDIPATGYCASNLTFLLKIDGEAPPAPENFFCNAYGRVSEHTKDASINLTWDEVTDEGSGLDSYYYSIHDNAGTTNGTETKFTSGEVTGLIEGPNDIYIWCIDKAGNIGSSNRTEIFVDRTAPLFTNLIPGDGEWFNDTRVDCSVDITDYNGTGVDVESIFYAISFNGPSHFTSWVPVWAPIGGEVVTPTIPVTFSDGVNNYIKWRVMDSAENGFSESPAVNVKVDVSPIEFSEDLTPEALGWFGEQAITFTIAVKDNGESGLDVDTLAVRYAIEGSESFGPWLPLDPGNISLRQDGYRDVSVTFSFTEGGANRIQFRGTDIANNPLVYSRIFAVKVDLTPVTFGEFVLGDIDDPSRIDCSIYLGDEYSGVDLGSIEYCFSTEGSSNVSFGDWTPISLLDIYPGDPVRVDLQIMLDWGRDNYIQFRANDIIGTSLVESALFRINITSSPDIKISLPPNDWQEFLEQQFIIFDGTESLDKDGDVLSFSWFSNISGFIGHGSVLNVSLPPGNHTITLYGDDGSGNNISEEIHVKVKVESPAEGNEGVLDSIGLVTGENGFGMLILIGVALLGLVLIIVLFIFIVRKKKKSATTKSSGIQPAVPPGGVQTSGMGPGMTPGMAPGTTPGPLPGPIKPVSSHTAPQNYTLPQQSPRPGQTHVANNQLPSSSTPISGASNSPGTNIFLPPPPDPRYSLPIFSTKGGEQDLNQLSLPPAPKDKVEAPAKTKNLPPPPGAPRELDVTSSEVESLGTSPKTDSIDMAFKKLGLLGSDETGISPIDVDEDEGGDEAVGVGMDDLSDVLPEPQSSDDDGMSMPSTNVPQSPETGSEIAITEVNLQCHSCGSDYIATIEIVPVLVVCPHCGMEGQIDSI